MVKKVLVLSSSPRRNGNSEAFCEQFMKGARSAMHEVEKINLNDYHINPCFACDYCRHHEGKCCQKDDADTIISKMIEADVWLLASPVYFYSISAQMKLLIDRFYAREYEVRDSEQRKKVYYLLTSGAPTLKDYPGALESLRGFIQVLRTVDEGGLIDGLGAFQLGDAKKHPALKKAYQMGLEI